MSAEGKAAAVHGTETQGMDECVCNALLRPDLCLCWRSEGLFILARKARQQKQNFALSKHTPGLLLPGEDKCDGGSG